MKSTVEPAEGNKVKVAVEIDETELEPAVEAAWRQIAKEVRLPGFRPGKAPRKLLEKQFGSEFARSEALKTALPEFYSQAIIEHDFGMRDGRFTTQALSQGQRKRLALIVAWLERRPVLILDEWAADQDPLFKEIFYREVLPELRAQGKSVLVISHDDRYFHTADRVVRLERGRIVGEPLLECEVA